jgi:hypothetical protein
MSKSVFSPRLFDASAAPRPQNSDSDEKDTLFGLDTLHYITITVYFLNRKKISIYEKVRILTFL